MWPFVYPDLKQGRGVVVGGGHSGTGTVNGLTHVDWTLLGTLRVLGHMVDYTNVNCIWDVG